ncbi:hypothetical protein BGZ58_009336 [Dissophora ornata]|nr:hypothetical protein BGZ58_009336 [Dissophora ornata]
MSVFSQMTVKDPRLSQVLPIVHCSDCGNDVMFGELTGHVCTSAPAMPVLPLYLSKHSPKSKTALDSKKTTTTSTSTTNTTTSKIPLTMSPLSPLRTTSVTSRPALPFLEKYSKRKYASAPAMLSQPIVLPSQQSNTNSDSDIITSRRNSQQQPTVSPIVAAVLSYGLDSPRRQRDTLDYPTPKSSMEDRVPAPQHGRNASESRSRDPMMETTCSYPVRPKPTRIVSQQLPVVPRKSAARTSGIAARGLGISMDPSNNSSRRNTTGLGGRAGAGVPDARTEFGKDREREREWEKSNRSAPVIADSRSNSSDATSTSSRPTNEGVGRTFSSRLAASSLLATAGSRNRQSDRSSTSSFDRMDRSMSEVSEESEKYSQCDDMTYPDDLLPQEEKQRGSLEQQRRWSVSTTSSGGRSPKDISAVSTYKTASPPLSPLDETDLEMLTEQTSTTYRPLTPAESTSSSSPSPVPPKESTGRYPSETRPKSKNTVDHFEALMEDLMQEIRVLPPAPRESTRIARPSALEPRVRGTASPTPAALAQTRTVRRSEDMRNSPSPTPAQQQRSLRRADDSRASLPTPAQPKTVRRSEDMRGTVSPVPVQSRIQRRSEDIRKATTSPTPVQPPRATRNIASPTPLQPRATRRAPVVIPMQEEPIRRCVDTRRPTSPVASQSDSIPRSVDVRRPMSPSASQTKVILRSQEIRRPTSPIAPIQTRSRQVQESKVVGTPAPVQPRNPRRSEDLRRTTASPTPTQPNALHRINETRVSSPTPVQTKVTQRVEESRSAPILTLDSTLSKINRRSDDMRNPSPPSPEQPTVARQSEDFRNQRTVKEQKERAGRSPVRSPILSPVRETRSERLTLPERSERREREHETVREKRVVEREIVRERSREPARTQTAPTAARVEEEHENVRERERSTTTTATRTAALSPTRNRSKNGRGGIERCADCKQDILPSELADSIKMAFSSYHMECLNCAKCRRPIESSLHAHEYEGRVLCERDFALMIAKELHRPQRRPTCAGCEATIQSTDRTVYALGKPWHEHHLCCYHCLKPIKPSVGHLEKNNRIYCHKDYKDLFLPKCKACGLSVEKDAVCAQDGKLKGKWHSGCFRCTTCKRGFPDKKFYVYKEAPYCRRHYHRLNNSLCTKCDEPIEGPCAQTMEGWRFHTKCFSCAVCSMELTDTYYGYEGQTYCELDILIIQRTKNFRAERCKTVYSEVH